MKTIRTTITNGVQTVFPVSFELGFIDKAHIYVYTGNNVYTSQIDYTWVNGTTIETTQVLPANTELHIRRVVPKELINDYTNNAILDERNLDDSFLQPLMWLEELADGFMTDEEVWALRVPLKMFANIDMNNYRILNLPAPTTPTEPVRLTDFTRLLTESGAGVQLVGTTDTFFDVGQQDHTKHFICSANTNVLVTLQDTDVTKTSAIVFFTQIGEGVVRLEPQTGVQVIHPQDSLPTTYDKGSTIAAMAISSHTWIIVGNLGY